MKKRVLFTVMCGIILAVFTLGVLCPIKKCVRYIPAAQSTFSLMPKDVSASSGCEVSEKGRVTITGSDPYIVYSDVSIKGRTLALVNESGFAGAMGAQLYYDTGDGFNETQLLNATSFAGDHYLCFNLPDVNILALRIDVDQSYSFDNAAVYPTETRAEYFTLYPSPWRYFAAAFVVFTLMVLIWVADRRFSFSVAFYSMLQRLKKDIFQAAAGFLLCAVLSAGAECLISRFFTQKSPESPDFNFYRFFFLFCGSALLCWMILRRRDTAGKPCVTFAGILLLLGTAMIIVSPFGHISWDLDSHYRWSLGASYATCANITAADTVVLTNGQDFWTKNSLAENEALIARMNELNQYAVGQSVCPTTIAHIPAGMFIAAVRCLGGSFLVCYNAGRFANLLLYALICCLAMKRLKSGKMILAVIALFPTNLLLATNYSYDYWVIAFSMLGTACFIGERQQPDKPVAVKDTIIMCGAFALACLPKQIYAPLLILPFLMRKNNFRNRKKYYCTCLTVFAVLALLLLMRSFTEITGSGDLRGGAVSPLGQIKYILFNPFSYAKTLLSFLCGYLSIGQMKDYICMMGYLGMASGAAIFVVLMIFTAVTDKSPADIYSARWDTRTLTLLLYFGLSALIATALYLAFTPVGSDYIAGCQGRYITPLLFPLLICIGSGRFKNPIPRSLYNNVVLFLCAATVYYDIGTVMLKKLM